MQTKGEPKNSWAFSKPFQQCPYIICTTVNTQDAHTNTREEICKHCLRTFAQPQMTGGTTGVFWFLTSELWKRALILSA